MPDDRVVLPRAGRMRRAGDRAPILRGVVEAVVDGRVVAWDDAEQRGRTPVERAMTRQLRNLTTLAGLDGHLAPVSTRGPYPALRGALASVATLQCLLGTVAAAGQWWYGGAAAWRWLLPITLLLLSIVTWRRSTSLAAGPADLLLLAGAWTARPSVEMLANASASWAILTAPVRLLRVEAALPLLVVVLALGEVERARFTWRDTGARALTLLALASALALAPAAVSARRPAGLPIAIAASALLAFGLRWSATRAPGPARRPATPLPRRALTAVVGAVLRDAAAAWNGTHTRRLAAFTADAHRARTPRELAAALAHEIVVVTGASRAVVLVPRDDAWTALGGEPVWWPADSAVAALAAGTDGAVRVAAGAAMHACLPEFDRRWVQETGVELVARLASPDGHVVGALVIGAREDGRASSRRDVAFVSAVAGIGGVALAALEGTPVPPAPAGESNDDELPYECQACGRLSPEAARCACGGATGLAVLPAVLAPGFLLERRIGRGGMGVVYRAWDTRLERVVALKTLPAVAPASVQALRAEARAMAAIEHPSVASLYGLETWRGTPVLVVEHLAGGTLAARIASGPMRAGDVVALARVLADALTALHARGWVHGDIKPSNIGLTRDGLPKLLDFGLTRLHAVASPHAPAFGGAGLADGTRPGLLAGTPLYLSPEALDGHATTESDDVWALSLVIVELITGVHPFRAATFDDVLARVRRDQGPVDVRRWAPATPPRLAEILATALDRDPGRRLSTARALGASLAAVLPGA